MPGLTLVVPYPATKQQPKPVPPPLHSTDSSPYNRFVYLSLYINVEGGCLTKVAVWVYNLLLHSVTYCSVIWDKTRQQYSHFRIYCKLITFNEMCPRLCLSADQQLHVIKSVGDGYNFRTRNHIFILNLAPPCKQSQRAVRQ